MIGAGHLATVGPKSPKEAPKENDGVNSESGTGAQGPRQLGGLRKAFASKGDDVTLTRWIKLPERHAKPRTDPMPPTATRTRFLTRVIAPTDMSSILVSGHSNVKIGRDVRKGRLRGYWIYTLSLEERATCPSSCSHWRTCYGNNMPFAKRVDHRAVDFLPRLEAEIARLLSVRGRKGILIRLHALGDFYSPEYVDFWRRMLETSPRLAIFGYTARYHGPIGVALGVVKRRFGHRFAIRWSDGPLGEDGTVSIKSEADCPPHAFVCPEQTGKTLCCATCAACWSTTKSVAFVEH